MSVYYPVPRPLMSRLALRAPAVEGKTIYLPAAPAAAGELPSLVMAPVVPPRGPRL